MIDAAPLFELSRLESHSCLDDVGLPVDVSVEAERSPPVKLMSGAARSAVRVVNVS